MPAIFPEASWTESDTNPIAAGARAIHSASLIANTTASTRCRVIHSPSRIGISAHVSGIRAGTRGGNFRQQSAFFKGSLLTYTGFRYDSVVPQHRDKLTAASSFTPFIPGYVVGQVVRREINQFKPNVGLNYKFTPAIRVFANYSESYFLDQGETALDIANSAYRPEIANGYNYDYGFKGSLIGDRLNYTVSGYYINRENVRVTDLIETPPGSGSFIDVSRNSGNQLVHGYEVDVNWQATDALSALLSYGNVNSIYTDFGTSFPAAVGRKAQFIATYNGSVSLKYTPVRGAAKGFSANVGVTFAGATPTDAPNAGDVYATRNGVKVVTSSTGQWALKAPAYQLWSAGLRYQLPGNSSFSHTFAVNVNNAFNRQYFKAGSSAATRFRGEDRGVSFTSTLNHRVTKF